VSKSISSVALAFVILFNCLSATRGQQRPAAPSVEAAPAARAEATPAERRREAFEIVWQTVKENHFDPTFGGLDWDAVRREFSPLVARTTTDAELHKLLQTMLNRLKQSHFNVIPPEHIPEFVAEDAPATEDEEGEGAGEGEESAKDDSLQPDKLKLTEHLTHGIGVDLRIINGAAVLTRVEPDSPAARAGLRPGFILRAIDGRGVRSLLRTLRQFAIYDPSVRHQLPTQLVVGFLNGPPGTIVRLTYLDARNRPRSVSVERERLKGEMSPPLRSLPPQFVEFEAKRLRGRIGYIRFNVFAVPVMEKFCAAVRSMSDAPGLIVDLRGNRGGVLALLYGMGGLLSDRPLNLGEMRIRQGGWLFNTVPQRRAYTGQLVVMIDGQTQSAGEMFAIGLNETGRALIVGERSAGATLPSVVKELPTGALLQYAFADYRTPFGNAVEGRGIEPTVRVRLDRRALLAGRDSQLEAALDAITPSVAGDTRAGSSVIAIPEDEEETEREESALKEEALRAEKEKGEGAGSASAAMDAEVERIIERYEQAVGGREAFEKIETRISEGVIEGGFAGSDMSGSFQSYEKAPDRALSIINLPDVGRLRRGYTGTYGYEQAPLYGYRELRGAELAAFRAEADPRWSIRLRHHYPKMTLKGTHELDGAEVYLIEAVPQKGAPTMLFFDKRTGLLVRHDNLSCEDYREIDGVKLPFLFRSPQMVMRLTSVRHNVPIADETFVEEKNCFTG
jgi:carboxyl-terminal processing protease